jgi:hypothetical protein
MSVLRTFALFIDRCRFWSRCGLGSARVTHDVELSSQWRCRGLGNVLLRGCGERALGTIVFLLNELLVPATENRTPAASAFMVV